MSQRNVCCILFSSRHSAKNRLQPKSIAAEKEIVRDVTEKRLLHRVFIATQSSNRFHELPDSTFSLLAPNAPVERSISEDRGGSGDSAF